MPVPVGRLARCEQRQEYVAVVKLPFSKRHDDEAREEFVALREGIPAGLHPSLLQWSRVAFTMKQPWGEEVHQARLEYAERLTNKTLLLANHRDSLSALVQALGSDDELHLDVIDLALGWVGDNAADILQQFFAESRSAYCVVMDDDGNRVLQHRQPKEMSELFDSEANQPGRAAEHLRTAWSKCFGLNPDTKGACIEAVSAIEVAAKPVVSPNNSRTTLGTLCRDMKADLSKWETGSQFEGSVETVLSMMNMIWQGHLRHGDEDAPLEVPPESAEMTVQTAVLLVSWFRSGRIRLMQ